MNRHHELTPEEAVHDLIALKEYFLDTRGCAPMCLDYAIKVIEDNDATLIYEKGKR